MQSNRDDLTSLGSLFHDDGPAIVKACSANFVRCLGTNKCRKEPDQRHVFVQSEWSDEYICLYIYIYIYICKYIYKIMQSHASN